MKASTEDFDSWKDERSWKASTTFHNLPPFHGNFHGSFSTPSILQSPHLPRKPLHTFFGIFHTFHRSFHSTLQSVAYPNSGTYPNPTVHRTRTRCHLFFRAVPAPHWRWLPQPHALWRYVRRLLPRKTSRLDCRCWPEGYVGYCS